MGGPEIDILAVDAAASEGAQSLRHVAPPGSPCRNCGTALQGPWCHACGQKADDFHRSVISLLGETFDGLTNADGRIWRTLPRLLFRPGRLTAEYIEGRRAAQLPPVRMFLISVAILFLVGGLQLGQGRTPIVDVKSDAAATAATAARSPSSSGFHIQKPGEAPIRYSGERSSVFQDTVVAWGPRVALLSPLVMAPIVALVFIRRRMFFFDHLIFSMHSLTFQGLLFSAAFLARGLEAPGSGYIFWGFPLHLFFHLRGTYDLGILGTIWRTGVLVVGQILGFILLMIALILVGVAAAR